MPDHVTINGTISHVFAHRFVLVTQSGPVLADVTPKGLEHIRLRVGAKVVLEGEMKPSELKVSRMTCGDESFCITHNNKYHQPAQHHHHDDHASAEVAMKSAHAAGFETLAAPRRKPKHFEVLGRRHGALSELHIELDGHVRKIKAVDADDHKWRDAIAGARA